MNRVYWGYNPLTNHLLTSWDIQVAYQTRSFDPALGFTHLEMRMQKQFHPPPHPPMLQRNIQKISENHNFPDVGIKLGPFDHVFPIGKMMSFH